MDKKSLILHPLLFGVFPLFLIFSHNIAEASLKEFLFYVGGMLILVTLGHAIFHFFVRDRMKSGLLLSLFLLLFFSYGHAVGLIQDFRLRMDGQVWGPNALLYPLFGGVLLLGTVFFMRVKNPLGWTKTMNYFALMLIALCLFDVGAFYAQTGLFQPKTENQGTATVTGLSDVSGKRKPDIYFIVVDGYSRADMLQEMFHFDNTPFLQNLVNKGFFVVPKSTSNYVWTMNSIATTLNMKYLDELAEEMGVEGKDRKPIKDLIIHNEVMRLLKGYGYQVVVVSSSGFSTTLEIPADRHIYYRYSLSEFQNHLLNLTPVPVLLRRYSKWGGLQYEVHRNNMRFALDALSNLSNVPSPKFVYAHLHVPHAPFVFGAQGEPVTPHEPFALRSTLEGEEYIQGHNDQITFLNKKMGEVVDRILESSEEPPIIILQSDHGHRYLLNPKSPKNPDKILKNAMSNLHISYLPDGGSELFYEDMNLVNTFRLIFNHYFDMDFPILPDRNFFSTTARPYEFLDVTEKIRTVT